MIKDGEVNLLILRKEEKEKTDPYNEMFNEITGRIWVHKYASDFDGLINICEGES